MNEKITLNQVRPLYEYLRKQAENKKAAKYLELAGTFIFITLFLFLAIKPTALAISSLLGEIKSKEIATQKMKTKINSIIQAQESFSQAQEKYSILESGFPSNPNFYQAAVNLSTMAQQSSVNLKQLNFNLSEDDQQKDGNDSQTKSFQMTIATNSQYQAALSFIKEVLNNRRLINISSIKFSQTDKEENLANTVNLNLDTELPYSPLENEKN